jgi:hypothetical protein
MTQSMGTLRLNKGLVQHLAKVGEQPIAKASSWKDLGAEERGDAMLAIDDQVRTSTAIPERISLDA